MSKDHTVYDQLEFFGKMFGSLTAAADADRAEIRALTERARSATATLEKTATSFERKCDKVAAAGISAALDRLKGNLKAVEEAAQSAQANYERAGRYTIYKLATAGIAAVVIAAIVSCLVARWTVQNITEQTRLNSQSPLVHQCNLRDEILPCSLVRHPVSGQEEWAIILDPGR
ncbi:hypothetical protein [Rhizobium sp.]|uniref:hypothetical protein n=1 Tax=Rhizobium sp. TaxID=391 RepID=UPI00289B0346